MAAKVGFGLCQFHPSQATISFAAACSGSGRVAFGREILGETARNRDLYPRLRVLVVVAGHSLESFFQDAADGDRIVLLLHTSGVGITVAEVKIRYQWHKQGRVGAPIRYVLIICIAQVSDRETKVIGRN